MAVRTNLSLQLDVLPRGLLDRIRDMALKQARLRHQLKAALRADDVPLVIALSREIVECRQRIETLEEIDMGGH
jgi:hypothetical protein